MDIKELEALAADIRAFLITSTSNSGGHIGPNLGVVELTIALHYTFTSPKDKFIWDVGHQSYVHKILTGRASKFETLRQHGGLDGFPKEKSPSMMCLKLAIVRLLFQQPLEWLLQGI